jgi:hypothetical protein
VGLANLPSGLPFAKLFDLHFRPAARQTPTDLQPFFAALPRPTADLVMIETGCLRVPRNWEGDGQSTFMFDALARDRGGLFFSIDVTPESLETARRACSSATQLILTTWRRFSMR